MNINKTEIEELKKMMGKQSNETIVSTIPKGILGITDDKIQTVSFIFWFCYMVETSMNDLIQEAWTKIEAGHPPTSLEKEIMKELTGIDFNSLDQLSTFGDKIKVSESLMGETDFVKILWKLKNLRDDISHNRIDNLLYNGENILNKEVKEKMIIDFLEFSIKQGNEKPREFNNLSEDQIKEIATRIESKG